MLTRTAEPSDAGEIRLPDFLVIGALKAGTTYLDELLRTHPQLHLPATVKEVDFFTRHYERGPAWYARLFAGADERMAGEASPQYLADERCPARIHDLVPEARLLVSLRDPVQRAYSWYKHCVQNLAYEGDFDRFLADHPEAIEEGRYFALLSRYLERFPASQLHVVVFEDLVGDPARVMRDVFAFLGVDAAHQPPALEPVNVSRRPRFPRAYVQARRASRWLRERRGGGRVVRAAKRAGAPRLFGETDGFAPLAPATAARLGAAYGDDVAALSRLLDRDLLATWGSVARAGEAGRVA